MPDWYAHKSNRLVFWPLFPDIFPNTPIPFPMLIQTVEFLSCFNLLQSDIRYKMLYLYQVEGNILNFEGLFMVWSTKNKFLSLCNDKR
jgi:hypothetical protein